MIREAYDQLAKGDLIVSQNTKNLIYDKLNKLSNFKSEISFEDKDIIRLGNQVISVENLEEIFYQKWKIFKEIRKNKMENFEELF